MRELFHDLTDWTLGFAASDWALGVLLLVSFSESIVFPIPPDPLLIAVGVADPSSAVWVAALVTAASIVGAYVGHFLGRRVGRPLLYRLVPENKVRPAEVLFEQYGAWAIIAASITPIPYKVFTILAGVLDLPVRSLLLASLVGRGARFITIGVLILIFGESIQDFIQGGSFEWLVLAVFIAAAVLAVAYFIFHKLRANTRRAGPPASGSPHPE